MMTDKNMWMFREIIDQQIDAVLCKMTELLNDVMAQV